MVKVGRHQGSFSEGVFVIPTDVKDEEAVSEACSFLGAVTKRK